jgi:hypothetical protein
MLHLPADLFPNVLVQVVVPTDGGSIGQTFGPHMGFKSMAFSQIGWFLPLMHVQ